MEIIKSAYVVSSPAVGQCPAPDKPEFAFIGRSNVGKSSLINMLCGSQHLAKTSAAPGKTQLINHFLITSRNHATAKTFQHWYLVDLPGYGYAKVSMKNRRGWERMIEDYLRKRPSLINIFVLIDSRHSPQAIDLEFINQLGDWQLPFSLVFTKADKMKPGGLQRNCQLFMDALKENWEALPPFFVTSAAQGTGKQELLLSIQEMLGSYVQGAKK